MVYMSCFPPPTQVFSTLEGLSMQDARTFLCSNALQLHAQHHPLRKDQFRPGTRQLDHRAPPFSPFPSYHSTHIPRLKLTVISSSPQEVKLSETAAERDLNDSLAEIYSIIITLDGLEKAYIKDSIPEAEYTELCSRLLKQYKSNLSDENVAREFVDLETFKRAWDVRFPHLRQPAIRRLLHADN